jgi:phosphate transport system substrate-binding protein
MPCSFIRSVFIGAVLFPTLFLATRAHPQSTDSLNHVKKIYVDTFTGKLGGPELQQRITNDLRKSNLVEVVSDPTQANAVLKGTGESWIRAYVSVNPRASAANRTPVYGGFLSAQLVAKDNDTLWSYLVTPSRYFADIHEDLASQLTNRLIAALRERASEPSPTPSTQHTPLTIKAAGATFPAPLYQAWFDSFQQRHPGIIITYSTIGSDAGIQQLKDGKITFAASDVPLSSAQMAEMPSKVLQIATVLGAVVPIYHLASIGQDLRFTPEVLAGIYLGKIRRWNDPKIVAINHNVSLPDQEIVVVHRSDGSGTTFVWTDFLSKTDANWKSDVGTGTTVTWPIGQAAEGNDGVATAVAQTPYSIGYTELSYAIQRQLSYGTVRNAAGNFIQANLITLAAAAAGASPDVAQGESTLTNATGKSAYPIASLTWLLVPEHLPDSDTRSAVADFLEWILTAGQKECSALAYTPLPKEIVTHELDLVTKFKAGK